VSEGTKQGPRPSVARRIVEDHQVGQHDQHSKRDDIGVGAALAKGSDTDDSG